MTQLLPNAARVEDSASPLYFLHIPKTGGTTFHHFLSSQFVPESICPAHLWHDLIAMPAEQVGGYRFIWGHFYAYLHRHVGQSMRYLTLLRDPVERALSHYGHVMLHEGHYLHARAKQLGGFGAFIRDPELTTTLKNFQVRSLAMDLDPVWIASTMTTEELATTELERRLETATSAMPEEELLLIAKRRLEQMCFVGITERLSDSVTLLCRAFGWERPVNLECRNVNPERMQADQVSGSDLSLLRSINDADYELYEFANRLFEEKLGSDFTGHG